MDSYHKFSLQIPRYILAISAEWVSVEDVSLIQQISSCLLAKGDGCCQSPTPSSHPHGDQAAGGSSAPPCVCGSLQSPKHNVWINAVVPDYQESSPVRDKLSVFNSGWKTVHGPGDMDPTDADDDEDLVFADMAQKFGKSRNDVPEIPVEKLREYTGLVASELDKIADELPTGGVLLDVLWLMPTSTEFPIRERADAFLFSVLRRLEVWHKARVTIVLGEGLVGEDHPTLAHWKTFIESRVVALRKTDGTETKPRDILSFSSSLAWQGQVKYVSSRGTAFPPWPGFSLHRLEQDSHRSEPFIQILDLTSDQEVNTSQQSLDDSFVAPVIDMQPKYVVNETLEFIHLTNLHEIPSWFILPGRFEIRLRDKEKRQPYSRSAFWMHYLTHRLPGDGEGAICQLSCLEVTGPVPTARSQGLSTEVWTQGITTNPLNPTMPNVQLKGNKHTFFFLVHGDRKGRCIALPLVSPFMLNGAAHALLAQHESEDESTEERDAEALPPVAEVLESLPTLNGRQLREEEEELARMQVKALAMFVEKIRSEEINLNITPAMLIFLFNYMRRVYYDGYDLDEILSPSPSPTQPAIPPDQAAQAQGEEAQQEAQQGEQGGREATRGSSLEQERVERDGPITTADLANIPTELDQSPSQWVERQALQNRESIAHRLRRLRSEDMMLAGLSVPPPDDNIITLSAKEFRSHFKPNGQPKRDDLVLGQPALVRQSPRTRSLSAGHHNGGLSADDLMNTDFKKAIKLTYHGISYCQETPDSTMQDQRMVRLQKRCVRHEMSCTFTSHHQTSKKQTTLAIRSKRKHSPSKDHKAKVRKLSSSVTRKKATPSKRQSPRKRALSTKAGTTPKKSQGSTPRTMTTPRSRKKRPRASTSGSLTPKRLRCSTPKKSTPAEMVSPRRSARKLAQKQSSASFISPSSSSLPAPAATSSSSSLSSSKRKGSFVSPSSSHMPTRAASASSSSIPAIAATSTSSSSSVLPASAAASSISSSSSSSKRRASFVSPSSAHIPTRAGSTSSVSSGRKESEKGKDLEEKSRRSSSTSESRSEKHKRKLRSIVEETLKSKGIDSSHACYKQCVTRLYTQTKMFVKDLKTSKGLYDEMKKIAEANADFVISFELKRITPKS